MRYFFTSFTRYYFSFFKLFYIIFFTQIWYSNINTNWILIIIYFNRIKTFIFTFNTYSFIHNLTPRNRFSTLIFDTYKSTNANTITNSQTSLRRFIRSISKFTFCISRRSISTNLTRRLITSKIIFNTMLNNKIITKCFSIVQSVTFFTDHTILIFIIHFTRRYWRGDFFTTWLFNFINIIFNVKYVILRSHFCFGFYTIIFIVIFTTIYLIRYTLIRFYISCFAFFTIWSCRIIINFRTIFKLTVVKIFSFKSWLICSGYIVLLN